MTGDKKVLVIGRHAEMLERVTSLIRQQGYVCIGKLTNEEALLAFQTEKIDAVVIGGGVDLESRNLFHREFTKLNPSVKLIDAHPQSVLKDLEAAFRT